MRHSSLLFFAGFALVGCIPEPPKFVEPPAEAPHALTVVKTVHVPVPRHSQLEETLVIDGRRVGLGAIVQASTAIRVAPGGARWVVNTRYYHIESVSRLEDVSTTETERDSCASHDSKGHCESGTKYVTKHHLETVIRHEEVTDATCNVGDSFDLTAGRSYRVSYSFGGSNVCSLTCDDVTDNQATPCLHPTASTPSAISSSSASEVAHPRSSVHPLVGLGAGAIVLGTVALTGAGSATIFAINKKTEVGHHCTAAGTCDSVGLDAAQDGRIATRLATIGAIAGGALAVGGLGLVLFGPSSAGAPATTGSIAPTPGGAKMTLGRSF